MPYVNPEYLVDGMVVWVDCRLAGIKDRKPGTGLKCLVVSAHGHHGLVENEKHGFRRLLGLDDMFVELTNNPERVE